MVHLSPVQPVTVFQAVFDQLSALLTSDAFTAGERLPTEREFAVQLGVSRPSVREALQALRVLGLIEVRGRSTYVRGRAAAPAACPPVITLPLAAVERREIEEFREAVELSIAERAAEHGNDRGGAALARLFSALQNDFSGDADAFFAADRVFHQALAEASGNRLLLAAHTQIEEHARLQFPRRAANRRPMALDGAITHTIEAHRQIVAAVRARNGSEARRQMADHLAYLRQCLDVGLSTSSSKADEPGSRVVSLPGQT